MRAVKNSYWKQEWKNVRRYKDLLALFTIVIAYFVIFKYIPMYGVTLAFKDFRLKLGILRSPWAGLKHFRLLFSTPSFFEVLRNTVSISLLRIVFGFPAPILLALLLNELRDGPFKKTVQTVSYLPHFLSWVVVSYFVFAFLNTDYGMLNRIVVFCGGEPHRWYSEATYWPLFFVILKIWKGTGYGMVVYLASITGIDGSLYEAAMLDGASKWQQAKYITLPMLKTVIVMMFILSVGGIFASDFGLFYQVTQGVPNSLYKVASTFDTYVYAALQGNAPIGKTAAASTFQSVACCITILLANFIVSKIDEDSAVF